MTEHADGWLDAAADALETSGRIEPLVLHFETVRQLVDGLRLGAAELRETREALARAHDRLDDTGHSTETWADRLAHFGDPEAVYRATTIRRFQ